MNRQIPKLVDYDSDESSSAEDQEGHLAATARPSTLPGLPAAFNDLYQVQPRKGDDPEYHQGRSRTQEHITGMWPTHIYLDFEPSSNLRRLSLKVIERFQHQTNLEVHSLLESEFGIPRELHVSLSAPLMLHETLITSFRASLCRITIPAGILAFERFALFENADKTRSFLVIECSEVAKKTCSAISQAIDIVLQSHGLAAQPENVVFHASIAWITGPDTTASQTLCTINDELACGLQGEVMQMDHFKLKIGKDIDVISMSA